MNIELGGQYRAAYGHAQEVIVRALDHPDQAAVVGCWFITAPHQSPVFDNYMLSVIHLRAIEGESQPAVLRATGVTHEVVVVALDPSTEPVAHDPASWTPMHPLNVEHQVRLTSDNDAKELGRLCVEAICQGRLWAEPPLAGQQEPWTTTLDMTAAHFRGDHDG